MKKIFMLAFVFSGFAHAKDMSCLVVSSYKFEQQGKLIAISENKEMVDFTKNGQEYKKDFYLTGTESGLKVISPIKGFTVSDTETLFQSLSPVFLERKKDFKTSVQIIAPESGILGVGKEGSWKKKKLPMYEISSGQTILAELNKEGVDSKFISKSEKIVLAQGKKDSPGGAANTALGIQLFHKDFTDKTPDIELKYVVSFDCSKDSIELNVNNDDRSHIKELSNKESVKKIKSSTKQ